MAKSTDRRVALISVHPEFADKILSGEKRVELRRSKLHSAISHLVIYATAPRSVVLGWVKVTDIESGSPTKVWDAHKKHAGISRARFRQYFEGCRSAVAIHVDDPQPLQAPMRLSEINDGLAAPQSWRYLSHDDAVRVGIVL